jgi:hypothetical protein
MEGGLRAWKALEGLFEMMTKGLDALKIKAWFQWRDIASDKGGNFIISDGLIHGTASQGAAGNGSLPAGASGISLKEVKPQECRNDNTIAIEIRLKLF